MYMLTAVLGCIVDRAGICSAHLHLYNHESKQIYFLAVLTQTYLCIIEYHVIIT